MAASGGSQLVVTAWGGPRSVAAAWGGTQLIATAWGGPRSVAAAGWGEPSPASRLACNFLMVSLICFRYWEFWSLGGLEDFYNLLRNSKSPNLPAAKAIKVILMFIPTRSAGGGLTGKAAFQAASWHSRTFTSQTVRETSTPKIPLVLGGGMWHTISVLPVKG